MLWGMAEYVPCGLLWVSAHKFFGGETHWKAAI